MRIFQNLQTKELIAVVQICKAFTVKNTFLRLNCLVLIDFKVEIRKVWLMNDWWHVLGLHRGHVIAFTLIDYFLFPQTFFLMLIIAFLASFFVSVVSAWMAILWDNCAANIQKICLPLSVFKDFELILFKTSATCGPHYGPPRCLFSTALKKVFFILKILLPSFNKLSSKQKVF